MSRAVERAYLPSKLNEMANYAPIILRIQPGLTGWWQVMGRHGTTFEQRLRMDEEHQQLVAVDGLPYPDENGLGGSGREGGVGVYARSDVGLFISELFLNQMQKLTERNL